MVQKRPGVRSQAQLDVQRQIGNAEPPITLYLHCQRTYELMLSQSKRVEVDAIDSGGSFDEEPSDMTDTMIVWEGMLTRLIQNELSLSVPYYTSVTRALRNMGCIRQLRRGGGTSPSQWELLHAPDEESFNAQQTEKVTKPDKHAMLQDQLQQLNRRVLDLESNMAQLLGQRAS